MSSDAPDSSADRLLKLSDQVSRIATSLARLSSGQAEKQARSDAPVAEPEITVETINAVIKRRRRRGRYIPEDLLADPVWDMMLDLLKAEVSGRRVSVSSVCAAAGVPASTALRWLKMIEERGLVTRQPDPYDGRRVFVSLHPKVSAALRKWFADAFGQAA